MNKKKAIKSIELVGYVPIAKKFTPNEIKHKCAELDIAPTSVAARLIGWCDLGLIKRVKRGVYFISSANHPRLIDYCERAEEGLGGKKATRGKSKLTCAEEACNAALYGKLN